MEPKPLPPNKELALTLIDSLMFIAEEDEKERVRLKRLTDLRYQPVGISSMQHHLPILKELIEKLKD